MFAKAIIFSSPTANISLETSSTKQMETIGKSVPVWDYGSLLICLNVLFAFSTFSLPELQINNSENFRSTLLISLGF